MLSLGKSYSTIRWSYKSEAVSTVKNNIIIYWYNYLLSITFVKTVQFVTVYERSTGIGLVHQNENV